MEDQLFSIIQSNLIQMLNQQAALRIMVKAAGYYDTVVNVIPKVIIYLTRDHEGLSILKELGIDDKITELTTPQSTE